jgi:hypothetical protein
VWVGVYVFPRVCVRTLKKPRIRSELTNLLASSWRQDKRDRYVGCYCFIFFPGLICRSQRERFKEVKEKENKTKKTERREVAEVATESGDKGKKKKRKQKKALYNKLEMVR